jgi:RNA polymerase sigma-70 factor (ECF subfamily)
VSTTAANRLIPLQEVPLVRTTGEAAGTGITLLTRRLAAGEEEAFREFHGLYFDRLHRFLLGVTCGQEEAAQEALQETLLRLLRHRKVFHDEEVFWCWLKAVARNAARDGHRKNRRYFAVLQNFFLGHRCEGSESAGDEDRLGALLEESLEELAPEDRRLLENKYLEGETVRELSALAGLSEKAMESRLLRLRRQLRERILAKLRAP